MVVATSGGAVAPTTPKRGFHSFPFLAFPCPPLSYYSSRRHHRRPHRFTGDSNNSLPQTAVSLPTQCPPTFAWTPIHRCLPSRRFGLHMGIPAQVVAGILRAARLEAAFPYRHTFFEHQYQYRRHLHNVCCLLELPFAAPNCSSL